MKILKEETVFGLYKHKGHHEEVELPEGFLGKKRNLPEELSHI